jgi:hypothetical protein
MLVKNNTNFIRKNTGLITLWMILCFSVSYLPVTNSWYLAMNGQDNLSRIVASVVRAKIELDEKTSAETVNQTINNIFKELKIATGIIKVQNPPRKGKISLIEINPDKPLQPAPFRLLVDKRQLYALSTNHKNYQSVSLSIETPPPNSLEV